MPVSQKKVLMINRKGRRRLSGRVSGCFSNVIKLKIKVAPYAGLTIFV